MTTLRITTIGFGHAPAPEADVVFDLRRQFRRDPHEVAELRERTARDSQDVVAMVLGTPGVQQFAVNATVLLAGLLGLGADVHVVFGCVGGRHRAPTIGEHVAGLVSYLGFDVEVTHRDIDKPVVERGTS